MLPGADHPGCPSKDPSLWSSCFPSSAHGQPSPGAGGDLRPQDLGRRRKGPRSALGPGAAPAGLGSFLTGPGASCILFTPQHLPGAWHTAGWGWDEHTPVWKDTS